MNLELKNLTKKLPPVKISVVNITKAKEIKAIKHIKITASSIEIHQLP